MLISIVVVIIVVVDALVAVVAENSNWISFFFFSFPLEGLYCPLGYILILS